MTRRRIIVLGGGVGGLSTAHALARDGDADVTLVEREARHDVHSTGRSAEILRVAVDDPVTRALALETEELDRVYDLPYTRMSHTSYKKPIPADQMIRESVTIMRGCFGGCTFCSITMHQGNAIQSRSEESILKEVKTMAADPTFNGVISDLGGPTANMYRMRCTKPEVEAICKRASCVHPTVCKLLDTSRLTALGWKPSIGLREGIASTVAWYCDQVPA